jgi:putative membrane protein
VEFVYRVLATAVAVWVATLLPGIDVGHSSTAAEVGTLVVVAVLFGLINTLIKPVVKVAGCVFYVLTFGLIGLVVNGLLFWLAAWVTGRLGLPFAVHGFWAGVFGAIVVSVISSILMIPLHRRASARHERRAANRAARQDRDQWGDGR